MTDYYLYSKKHTSPDNALWWRPDGEGYTTSLDEAGVYNEEYVNHPSTQEGIKIGWVVAIPCAQARDMSKIVVDTWKLEQWVSSQKGGK